MEMRARTATAALLVLCTGAGLASAQVSFGPRQVILEAGAPFAIDVLGVDLDGDGDRDILMAAAGDNRIAWYENLDGQANFGPQRRVAEHARPPNMLAAADLDGDGDRDVVVASSAYDTIAWYANDGLGGFGPQQVFGVADQAISSIDTADVDGDGDIDVLASAENEDVIAWYENSDGQGSFGAQRIISTQTDKPMMVHAADLDGDGDVDVLSISTYDSKLAWYENTDGQGGFGPQQVIASVSLAAAAVHAADLDGDGDLDVLSAANADDHIAWYENDGQGAFGPAQSIAAAPDGSSAFRVSAADLDGDGDADVLAGFASGPQVAWAENTDGQGTFGPLQVITEQAEQPNGVRAADLDGDGDLDVLSASSGDDTIAWYENSDGLGDFGPQQALTSAVGIVNTLQAADVDGDGDTDLLAITRNGELLAWQANLDGQGHFGPQQAIAAELYYGKAPELGDLDGDGDQDLLTIPPIFMPGEFYLHRHTFIGPAEGFGPAQQIPVAMDLNAVHAADLDLDGDADILVSSYDQPGLAWYENSDGLGGFGPMQAIDDDPPAAWAITTADINGDGAPDVLVTGDGSIVTYHSGAEPGSFGPPQVFAEDVGTVEAVDLDGDGDMDLLASGSAYDPFGGSTWYFAAWFENSDGQGNFSDARVIDYAIDFVDHADVDGDGDADLVALSREDEQLVWYENTDGQASFGPRQIIAQPISDGLQLETVDLNGDGARDALLAAFNLIAWYENGTTGCWRDGLPCDSGAGQDGDLCNSVCSGGECVPGEPQCDDGLFCNGEELCDPIAGCIAGEPPCDAAWCVEEEDDCVPPPCGDGQVQAGEECDDGDQLADDGCSAECTVESGWVCDAAEPSNCQTDADGDGVPDAQDNCPDTPNPDQADSDGDGQGDACESGPDADGDGVPDAQDNCPDTPNPDQVDSDGDGQGDACEPAADRDDDGIADADDNCPDTPNPDQADTDGDGQGDACQPDPQPDGGGCGCASRGGATPGGLPMLSLLVLLAARHRKRR